MGRELTSSGARTICTPYAYVSSSRLSDQLLNLGFATLSLMLLLGAAAGIVAGSVDESAN